MLLSTAFETVPSWLFSVIKGVCFSLIIVTYRLVVLSLWSLTLTKKAFTSAYCDRFLSSSTVSHLFIWRHNLVTWVLCEFCWTRLVCAWIRQQLYMWDDCSSCCLQFLHFQVTFSGLDSGANPDPGEYLSGELTRATGLHWGAGGGASKLGCSGLWSSFLHNDESRMVLNKIESLFRALFGSRWNFMQTLIGVSD